MPWGGTDSVSAAAQTLASLQSIISRRIDITQTPAMLAVGSLHAGNRVNVVPDSVEMAGTIRTFNDADRDFIQHQIRQISQSMA